MRITVAKLITIIVIVLNVIALYFIWKLLSTHGQIKTNKLNHHQSLSSKDVKISPNTNNDVTFIIRSFESFEHDLLETIESIRSLYLNATILIVSDYPLYPPILLNTTNTLSSNTRFVSLKKSLISSFDNSFPLLQVKSKFLLFIPDSTRLHSKKLIDKLVNVSNKEQGKIIAIPFKGSKSTKCLKIHLKIREWLLRFDEYPNSKECDYVKGKHALFVELQNILTFTDPLMLPFPDSLYLQSAARDIKVILADELQLSNGRELFKSRHNQWKAQQAENDRQKTMFHNLELKKVIRENGVVEWYGCKRDTPRCFGTIIDETPQYLWEGKWTPPCCLAGLRTTAHHVFEQLEEARVRYWLEGGSLLGAMRSGDILPWDYDIDIDIYQEDIPRCTWLLRAAHKPVVDTKGFVWEKAVEGDFFRVQLSQVNRLHVDIFPFYSKNGTMTKDTWFKNHRQDMEFPEHYLKPLSSIEFVGRTVSAPNNIHDFLELKFGEGAIENPEYPNPYKMAVHGLPRGPNS